MTKEEFDILEKLYKDSVEFHNQIHYLEEREFLLRDMVKDMCLELVGRKEDGNRSIIYWKIPEQDQEIIRSLILGWFVKDRLSWEQKLGELHLPTSTKDATDTQKRGYEFL